MPILTIKSVFFGCHDAKWVSVLLKKLFFAKQIDFSKTKYKNVQYFNLVNAHKLWTCFYCFESFIALFHSFSSALLLSLHFAFHILSGSRKKSWVPVMVKAKKWDFDQLQ